ncbi:hypothetical protein ACIQ7D_17930 [Streptomyces sp. NPDC096310]|uniref:hypothetical protein n=1 Tax=Streptomyces sp. NPDC096310 TaxID=3366082 RepID=UPI0038221CB6
MTIHLTDPDGDSLHIAPAERDDGTPVVHLGTSGCVHIPLDHVDAVIAGLREAKAAARITGGRP